MYASCRHLDHPQRLQAAEEVARACGVERRVAARMQRKKRLRDARSKSAALNTGWFSRGRPFRSSMPRNAASAAREHGHLEGRRDERGPAVQRPAARVDRVVDDGAVPLQEVDRRRRRAMPPRSVISGTRLCVKPSASGSPSTAIGRVGVDVAIAASRRARTACDQRCRRRRTRPSAP